MKKTIKKLVPSMSTAQFKSKVNHLVPGRSVESAQFGTVKCVKSAKDSKNGKRMFSVSKSKVARNGGNYTFDDICKAFGLNK